MLGSFVSLLLASAVVSAAAPVPYKNENSDNSDNNYHRPPHWGPPTPEFAARIARTLVSKHDSASLAFVDAALGQASLDVSYSACGSDGTLTFLAAASPDIETTDASIAAVPFNAVGSDMMVTIKSRVHHRKDIRHFFKGKKKHHKPDIEGIFLGQVESVSADQAADSRSCFLEGHPEAQALLDESSHQLVHITPLSVHLTKKHRGQVKYDGDVPIALYETAEPLRWPRPHHNGAAEKVLPDHHQDLVDQTDATVLENEDPSDKYRAGEPGARRKHLGKKPCPHAHAGKHHHRGGRHFWRHRGKHIIGLWNSFVRTVASSLQVNF